MLPRGTPQIEEWVIVATLRTAIEARRRGRPHDTPLYLRQKWYDRGYIATDDVPTGAWSLTRLGERAIRSFEVALALLTVFDVPPAPIEPEVEPEPIYRPPTWPPAELPEDLFGGPAEPYDDSQDPPDGPPPD